MKSNVLLALFVSLSCLGAFSTVFIDVCSAEEDYIISMDEPTYEFIQSKELGGRTYAYFSITVVLHNSGTEPSPEMTVEIEDEYQLPERLNDTLGPGESKTFVFDEIELPPVEDKNEYKAYISYYPTDELIRNSYNQHEEVLTLEIPEQEGDGGFTPGFEIVLLVLAIISYVFIMRFKK
jgi:hypothetical protein